MKVKIIDLLNSNPILGELYQKKLNGAVAFKVYGLIKESDFRLKHFEEVRAKLLLDNEVKVNEETGKYEFTSPEIEKKVAEEFDQLTNDEIEFNARPLTMVDLEKIPEMSPVEMQIISWAVQE